MEFRFEKKFPVGMDELQELRYWMHAEGLGFRRAFPDRLVHSIYFDSPDLCGYQDNLAGISERTKCRLRWYGETTRPDLARFEIKVKRNGANAKRVQTLPGSFPPEPIGTLYARLREVLRPELRIELDRTHWPIVYNRYRREYYATSQHIRLTVDTRIRCCKLLGRETIPRALGAAPEASIVEVKYPLDAGPAARQELRGFPIRPSRSSKYVNAVESCF